MKKPEFQGLLRDLNPDKEDTIMQASAEQKKVEPVVEEDQYANYADQLDAEREMYEQHRQEVLDELLVTEDATEVGHLEAELTALETVLHGALSEQNIAKVRNAITKETFLNAAAGTDKEQLEAPGQPAQADGWPTYANAASAGQLRRKAAQAAQKDKADQAWADAQEKHAEKNPAGNGTYVAWGLIAILVSVGVIFTLSGVLSVGLGLIAIGAAILPIFNLIRDSLKPLSFEKSWKKHRNSFVPMALGGGVLVILLYALGNSTTVASAAAAAGLTALSPLGIVGTIQ